jgi:radical SAM superfamily enzyme YgiQ (UPF0313 family)
MRQRIATKPKRHKLGARSPIALVFPNTRKVGLSNLGFQFLRSTLEQSGIFAPETFFVDEQFLKRPTDLTSRVLEGDRASLKRFPIVAFSIPFENDYWIVPRTLISAGIPPLRKDRRPVDPLVLAGGVSVSMNPEALGEFLDLVFIGELVGAIDDPNGLWNLLKEFCESRSATRDRHEFYRNFKDVQGVYVPESYNFRYKDDGTISVIEPEPGFPDRITAVKRLSTLDAPPLIILDDFPTEFKNSCLVEVNRGCARGCGFCSGGWIHRPVRHYKYDSIKNGLAEAIKARKTIGLIGSDLASHPDLSNMLNDIADQGGKFSLSSIRPEGLNDEIIKRIVESGQKTATLAPEVASERLKRVIGKQIPNKLFFELIEKLVSAGAPNLRFYFMIGLPTETEEDVKQIIEFVLESREIFLNSSRKMGKIGRIGVQLNAFVPKPWTPFQWTAALSKKEWDHRIKIIEDRLRGVKNLVVRHESTRMSEIQAVLSRADRRISSGVKLMAEQGKLGMSCFAGADPDVKFYSERTRGPEEIFPWDVVDHGVPKKLLRARFEKAIPSGKDI